MGLLFPELTMLPLQRYAALLPPETLQQMLARIDVWRAQLAGRAVWNLSSTAVSGGVAEMVRSLLSYARGAGVDARWAVIQGPPEFFHITKRIHNALHGNAGDGSPLGDAERRLYERVNEANFAELAPMVRAGDLVVVHDPQPAGMIRGLIALGARVIWRCHVGQDEVNAEVDRAWHFLAPYVRHADAYVFSRAAYVPPVLDAARAWIIPPSIDPFSAKNQPLDERCVLAILRRVGVIACDVGGEGVYVREDGTPARVDRTAHILCDGPAPPASTPLVVQVSRWDRLKDPAGVLAGFALLDDTATRGAHLVLAGPTVTGVADDPEGASVLADVVRDWQLLPAHVRARVHLASFPTDDIDENAAMVNALQRHARIVVQKSLHEGFGLTVTEAMWKSRPLVASAVGGIQDQVQDGVQGLLLADPRDLDAFAAAVARLLADPAEAERMGERGHTRVVEHYLGLSSLLRYGALIEWIDGRGGVTAHTMLASPA